MTELETAEPVRIHVFGDSHSRHLLPNGAVMAERLGIRGKKLTIEGEAIIASSIAGFRPKASTLQTKEIIRAALPQAQYLMLGFGQVDLELGYYYRRVIKEDQTLTPESYVPWLIDIYMEFIASMDFPAERLAVKGCHLTVFSNRRFTTRYLKRIITGEKIPEDQHAAYAKRLDAEVLGEARTNAMLMEFNAQLMARAAEGKFRYFDINEEIGMRPKPSGPAVLRPGFAPSAFDHHLVDSLALRRAYLRALLKSFDLKPKDYLKT